MLIAHMKTARHKKSFAMAKSAIKFGTFEVKETSILNTKVTRVELTILPDILQSIIHLSNSLINVQKSVKKYFDEKIYYNIYISMKKKLYIFR